MSRRNDGKRGMPARLRARLLAVGAAVSLAFGAAHAADKPNILFIVSDDTGYGDLAVR